MDIPHLSRAPIVEALLDIRVEPTVDSTSLEALKSQLGQTFPKVRPMQELRVGLASDETNVGRRSNGFEFRDSADHWAAQTRPNGFSISRINGYESWQELRDKARGLWNVYRTAASPKRVVRTAVRYVNRMDLELPIGDLGHFFALEVRTPAALPASMSELLVRSVIPFESEGSSCIVTMLVQPVKPEDTSASVVLDIDVFIQNELDAHSDEVWDRLEQHRSVKNKVFYAIVKEELWRRYQ
ncbi:MAG: TIGR04255 family protein [Myxococcota bacterium]